MKLSKNVPYILIVASLILIFFEFSKRGFQFNNETWEANILSILLLLVGVGLLFKINKKV